MGIVRYDNNVLRWDPFRELERLQSEINRAFETTTQQSTPSAPRSWSPSVDVLETEEAVTLHLELPGMKQEEIDIELSGETLTVRGERKRSHEEKSDHYVRIERSYGRFQRTFTLSTPIQNDKVSATYRDGILEVTLPKSEETKPRKIAVLQEA